MKPIIFKYKMYLAHKHILFFYTINPQLISFNQKILLPMKFTVKNSTVIPIMMLLMRKVNLADVASSFIALL